MRAALDHGLLATELADYLVKKGVPFREAHHIVGRAVKLGPLESLSPDALRQLSPAFDDDVAAVWNFEAAVRRRSVLGGTAPDSVHAQIAEARERLRRPEAEASEPADGWRRTAGDPGRPQNE